MAVTKIEYHNKADLPLIDYRELQDLQGELKTLGQDGETKLIEQMKTQGFRFPFYVWHDAEGIPWIVDGHGRLKVFYTHNVVNQNGEYLFPYFAVDADNRVHAQKLLLAVSSQFHKISAEGLFSFVEKIKVEDEFFNPTAFEFDAFDVADFFGGDRDTTEEPYEDPAPPQERVKLDQRFISPPLSILNTQVGQWIRRERAWKEVYEMRPDYFIIGTSIFNPVLCELMYRWFVPQGGSVLDPFAGGSVRGVIANFVGLPYTGIELRKEQVEANRKQWERIVNGEFIKDQTDQNLFAPSPLIPPFWVEGDSNKELDEVKDESFDFVFSCPPYADLEVYSDEEADLSNMPYEKFLELYRSIIAKACQKLKPNRFAVFVISEVRSKEGSFYNFVGDTLKAFTDAGMSYYNEIILMNKIGSLALCAGANFQKSRKIGRMHENIIVTYKGDLKAIRENYPELDLSDFQIDEEGGEEMDNDKAGFII